MPTKKKPAFPAHKSLSTHRIEALHDGVFAIVMTLLVLEFHVPDALNNADMLQKLWALEPTFLTYIISFVNLGIYWIGQHNQFHYIRKTDRILLWINITFMMFISLVPFSTALLGQHPNFQSSYLIYGGNLIILGILSYWHWSYATVHHRLVDHSIPASAVKAIKQRILFAPMVCALAIFFSFLSLRFSLILYALLPPYYIKPSKMDHHWKEVAMPHKD